MSAVKTYFKDESKWAMLGLEHSKPTDFYLSVWQTTRSCVPLLIFRTLLFLTSVAIILWSMILYIQLGLYGYWFIYLTHWGLLSIVFATGFATAVSARCYLYGPLSAEFSLPWFVKVFWVFYNVANPLAFLITIFYWTILYNSGQEEELSHGLDIAVHAINSLLMALLLFSSSHPTRLLHFYQPLAFAITYVLFGGIYHLAGGKDPFGNPWVYPVVNWAQPGPTTAVLAITALLLIFLYLATVGLAAIRDTVASKLIRPSVIVHVEEGMPLRQPQPTTHS